MKTSSLSAPPQSISGFPVGIIVVEEQMHILPGNVANAQTFNFPVLYEVLDGIGSGRVMAGDPAVGERVVEAGQRLVKRGVRAVVGACGSFANYQQVAAASLPVPTFLSVMLQVPLILAGLRDDQRIGVIAASAAALTPAVFAQCGIQKADRLVIDEAMQFESFKMLASCAADFDPLRLADDLSGLATKMVKRNPEIAALLLQCSDLPPFAATIQSAVPLPLFDMTSLVEWAANSCRRRPYTDY